MYVQVQCLLPAYNYVAEDVCSFLRALFCLSSVLEEFLHFYKQHWSHPPPLSCTPAMGRMIHYIFSLRDGKKHKTKLFSSKSKEYSWKGM